MDEMALPFTLTATEIDLSDIEVDTKVMMMRVKLDLKTVNKYARAMQDGAVFPPIIVFDIDGEFILADGFHRYHAYKSRGIETVRAEVRKGTIDDAVLAAVKADAYGNLRRTNEDKIKAVIALLNSKRWAEMSDREVARAAGVQHPFVGRQRKRLNCGLVPSSTLQFRRAKDGKIINTKKLAERRKKRKEKNQSKNATSPILGDHADLNLPDHPDELPPPASPSPRPPPLPNLTREQIGAPSEEIQDMQDPDAPPGTTYAMSFAAKYGHVHIRPLDVRLRQEREKKATDFVITLKELVGPANKLMECCDLSMAEIIASLQGMNKKAMLTKFEERMAALEPLVMKLHCKPSSNGAKQA